MKNIAIFASGTGSNFDAIYQAVNNKYINANIALFVTDRPKCKALEKAKNYNINTFTFKPKNYESKKHYEQAILQELRSQNIDLIVLAGYMRLIGPTILNNYPKKIINIHPSLLPSFKGIDAVGQAMAAKVEVTGVTVHYVDQGMDTGEIIAQEPLTINNLETRGQIETEIHKIEHKLYPKVIKQLLEDM